jgi:hypothetical protein
MGLAVGTRSVVVVGGRRQDQRSRGSANARWPGDDDGVLPPATDLDTELARK